MALGIMDQAEAKARKQIAAQSRIALATVLPRYGRTFRELEGPIPGPDAVLYCARESSGRRASTTHYPEAGLLMLTAARGDNECRRYDVDPFDPTAAVYAAQRSWSDTMRTIDAALLGAGFPVLALHPIEDAIALTFAPRAIGIGCTRQLIRRARGLGNLGTTAIRAWLDDPAHDPTPFSGQQTPEQVRARFAWCRLEPFDGPKLIGLGAWPRWQHLPNVRPLDSLRKPPDLERHLEGYAAAARRQGAAPTGAW